MVTLLRLRNWLNDHITRTSHVPEGVRLAPNKVVVSLQNGDMGTAGLSWTNSSLIITGNISATNRITLGAFMLKDDASSQLGVRNSADTAWGQFKCGQLITAEGIRILNTGYALDAANNADGDYFTIRARDSDTASLVEVGRVVGASDPYIKIGGLTALSSGTAGIGTITPDAPLHVLKGGSAGAEPTTCAILASNTSLRPALMFSEETPGAGSDGMSIAYDGTGSGDTNKLNFHGISSGGIHGAINMTIMSGGNIGIGWTSPTTKLDVNGTIRSKGVQWVGQTITGSTTCTLGTNGPSSSTTPTTWQRVTLLNAQNELTVGFLPIFV